MNLLPKKNPTTVNIGENVAYIEKELASDNELIRRSDAIKEIMNKPAWHGSEGSWFHSGDIKDAIESVPAVEPCKDAVSREWLLNELEEMNVANFYEANFHSNEMYGQMKRMIKAAPSVTVEPKHGEWIFQECTDESYGRAYERSICGVAVVGNHHNFCPHCGAKMKGADDE